MSDHARRIADLTPEKRALLTLRLKERRAAADRKDAPRKRPDLDIFPLSFAQQRLWFLDQLAPKSPQYNIPAALHLSGPLDVNGFHRSLHAIVQRHEVLRGRFIPENGRPVQVVASGTPLPLPLVDLRGLPATARQEEAVRLATQEARRPFSVTDGPLIRAGLIRIDDDEHIALLTMHHIVSDGWSTTILTRELSILYNAFTGGEPGGLPPLPVQYADYASWQRNRLQGERIEVLLQFWRERLDGPPSVLNLPTDRPRPAMETYQGARLSFDLPRTLSEKLKDLARDHAATLFMVLLAAFRVLLHRYTGQEEIFIGTPVANRDRSELQGLIGLFANTLVMRNDVVGDPPFIELLHQERSATIDALAHQELPFEVLVEKLRPERSLSFSPLFQVMFALQEDPVRGLELPGLHCRLVEIDQGTAKFDLTLFMTVQEDRLNGMFEYNRDLFDNETIAGMAGHFILLLQGIAEDPARPVSAYPLLSEAERDRLLDQWNDTGRDEDLDRCVHRLFEKRAATIPDAIALAFGDECLTYRALDGRANTIAHALAGLGAGPDTVVGVCIQRSPEMVAALLAILKAGAAYVPLDPAYPPERLRMMIEDSGAQTILTQEALKEKCSGLSVQGLPPTVLGLDRPWPPAPNLSPPAVLCLDDLETIARESATNPVVDVFPSNLAYVLFTSGSTGRPKGIAIEHRSVSALLHWADRVFTPYETAGVLASTSISWDLSVFEIFATLHCGGTVVLAENALQLPELPNRMRVTLINTVPSAIAELLRSNGIPESVETINLAGEPLPAGLVDQLYAMSTVKKVFDLYGPGEDTTYSTFTLRRASGPETIGRPINHSKAYLLDPCLQPVPTGVPGELSMGGAGLARGYFRRPEQTAERFLPDPFSRVPGARLYRTGDLARYLPDGNISYLGRMDHQVKVRGFRIELGEIQAALGECPRVREAVAAVREDAAGDRRLVAYVVPGEKSWPSVRELRDHLKNRLPEYMIPSSFVLLERLPLTPNGKLDRRALPAPDHSRPDPEAAYVAARTSTEELLSTIWKEVLKVDRVSVADNFFELGGHSLLATQVVSRIREALKLELPVRELFQTSTIADLAERVDAVRWAGPRLEDSLAAAGDREEGAL
jgi:amino acid adenylation domain-containing protein